jgi:hypothetical protein
MGTADSSDPTPVIAASSILLLQLKSCDGAIPCFLATCDTDIPDS